MNYYIQGNAAKAEEIKAAFEKLGYEKVNVIHIGDYANERLFFFTENGKVRSTLKDCGIVNIIKTHPDYKELELPAKPELKVGDWVVRKDGETFCSGNYAEQITSIVDDKKGKYIGLSSKSWLCGDAIRPWTIADAKDGDVLVYQDEIFIARMARGLSVNVAIDYDCCYDGNSFILDSFYSLTMEELKRVCPATKDQRDLLFAKMKEAGYEWDADKKELRKIKPHYDIANFKPFDKVLVRFCDGANWCCAFFSHYCTRGNCPFVCSGGSVTQCIPYNDDTKHLLGTTDMCPEEYINW